MPATKKSVAAVSQFMAFNHNGTPLCRPTTEKAANKELRDYTNATCNSGWVDSLLPGNLVTRGGHHVDMRVFG